MPPTPASRTVRLLLGVAALVLLGGVALAVFEPGDLGEDDVTSEDAADRTTSTLEVPGDDSTTTAGDGVTVTTAAAQESTTTVPPSSTTTATTAATTTSAATAPSASATTASTAPGSGLGSNGVSNADDATASTGIESMLGPGIALGATAVLLRRSARRR